MLLIEIRIRENILNELLKEYAGALQFKFEEQRADFRIKNLIHWLSLVYKGYFCRLFKRLHSFAFFFHHQDWGLI